MNCKHLKGGNNSTKCSPVWICPICPCITVVQLSTRNSQSHSPPHAQMDREELRDRQRRRVKHRYYQTLNDLNRSRELVQKLTDQHLYLQERHQLAALAEGRSSHALQRYTAAAVLTNELRQENQKLKELLDEREKLQDRLITLVDDQKRDLVGH